MSHDETMMLIALLEKASTTMQNLSEHPDLDDVPYIHRLRYRQDADEVKKATNLIRRLVFRLTDERPITT